MVPLGCGGGIEIEANLGSDAGETRLYDIGSILSSFIPTLLLSIPSKKKLNVEWCHFVAVAGN